MPEGSKHRISVPMDTIERRYPITLNAEVVDGQPRIFITGNMRFHNLVGTEAAANYDRQLGYPPGSEQSRQPSIVSRFLGKIGLE